MSTFRRGIVLATTVMLMSCTADDGNDADRATAVPGEVEVSAPEGFTVHRGDDYGFAFPFEWMPLPGGGTYADGAEVEIVGPSRDSGLPAIISLYREEGFVGDFDRYLFTFNGESATALPDRVVVRNEPLIVPQSLEARLIEAEYTLQGIEGLVDEPEEPEVDVEKGRPKKKDDRGENQTRKRNQDEEKHTTGDEDSQDPPTVLIRQVDVLVLTRDGVTINLRAAAPSEDFDDLAEIFTTVIDSLRVPAPVVGGA